MVSASSWLGGRQRGFPSAVAGAWLVAVWLLPGVQLDTSGVVPDALSGSIPGEFLCAVLAVWSFSLLPCLGSSAGAALGVKGREVSVWEQPSPACGSNHISSPSLGFPLWWKRWQGPLWVWALGCAIWSSGLWGSAQPNK